MRAASRVDRSPARAVLAGLGCAALLGCASTTAPGAVGVTRPQLLTAPAGAGDGYGMNGGAGLETDPALNARVRAVTGRLVRQVGHFREDARQWRWQVRVSASDELNASGSPSGRLVVTRGLIRRLDLSDAELAAVLGHEMAHALREHARERASQAQWSDAMVQTVQAVAMLGTRSAQFSAGVGAELAAAGSEVLVQLPYSREMESESDLIGLELMARAGYDPRAAARVWVKVAAAGAGTGPGDFLSTHPANASRGRQLADAVPKVLPLYEFALAHPQAETTDVEIAPTASAPAATPRPSAGRIGPDSSNVERLARARLPTCDAAVATLDGTLPGADTYTLACGPATLRYRCNYGLCQALE